MCFLRPANGGLFERYQRKCFEEIIECQSKYESPFKVMVFEVSNRYPLWIKELECSQTEDLDIRNKTLAMLRWHEVYSPWNHGNSAKSCIELNRGNCDRSYEFLGSVLEYSVQNLPRTRMLMIESIRQIDRIADVGNGNLEFHISEDYQEGTVHVFQSFRLTLR